MQLEAISSSYLGEETNTCVATMSFQVVTESNMVSPQPPLLQTKQSLLPRPLLIRLVLQTLHQPHCPSLDTLQHLNVLLVVRGPKLNTVLEVQPHQCRVQGVVGKGLLLQRVIHLIWRLWQVKWICLGLNSSFYINPRRKLLRPAPNFCLWATQQITGSVFLASYIRC